VSSRTQSRVYTDAREGARGLGGREGGRNKLRPRTGCVRSDAVTGPCGREGRNERGSQGGRRVGLAAYTLTLWYFHADAITDLCGRSHGSMRTHKCVRANAREGGSERARGAGKRDQQRPHGRGDLSLR
jgi:hypothetical protein